MEMTTIKTIAVFTIIFGCFAVLYPKIFHPMIGQLLGFGDRADVADMSSNRIPPHLKKPGSGKTVDSGDDISKYMRAGPHPGMRAAAEMKKQAAAQGGGTGKGMMAVVLPMYAVGIVIYLIYTMVKVFGNKKEKEKGGDFLNSHFSDVQYDPEHKKFTTKARVPKPEEEEEEEEEGEVEREEETISKRFKKGRQDLERLLLKADKNNINAYEMHELKRRLLETEAQMARILGALETVEEQPGLQQTGPREEGDEEWEDEPHNGEVIEEMEMESPTGATRPVDLSPDLESYEFIKGKSPGSSPDGSTELSPSIEVIGPDLAGVDDLGEVGATSPAPGERVDDADIPSNHAKCKGDDEQELEGREEMMAAAADRITDDSHPDLRKRVVPNPCEE